MNAVHYFETLVNLLQSEWLHVPEYTIADYVIEEACYILCLEVF
jgi:hypothetical protein